MTEEGEIKNRSGLGLQINGKLFLALSFLAGMSIVAGLIAWYSFDQVSDSTNRITQESLPEMSAALELAEASAEIAASAPDLMADLTLTEHRKSDEELIIRTVELSELIETSSSVFNDPEITARLQEIEKELFLSLNLLKRDVEEKLVKTSERNAVTANLSKVHQAFLLAMEGPIDDAVFNFVIEGERLSAKGTSSVDKMVSVSSDGMAEFLSVQSELDRVESLLSEALFADSQQTLEELEAEFQEKASEIEKSLASLQEKAGQLAFLPLGKAMLEMGRGPDSIFVRRALALKSQGLMQKRLEADLQNEFSILKSTSANFHNVFSTSFEEVMRSLDQNTRNEALSSTEAMSRLIDVGAQELHLLLSLRAEGNLVAGILSEVATVSSPAGIRPYQERFEASSDRMRDMLEDLASSAKDSNLHDVSLQLLSIGTIGNNIFAIREAELEATSRATESLGTSRQIAISLNSVVAKQVLDAKKRSAAAAENSQKVVETSKYLLLVVGFASLITALFVMFGFVRPLIIRPLEHITDAMTRLAAGDTKVTIPGRERNDEVGHMADALAVFRDTAIEIQESNHREIEEGRRRLSSAIESISEGFSFYDAEDRLAVCNSVYRQLFFPDESTESQIGRSFKEILQDALERNVVEDAIGREDEWLAEMLDNHRQGSSSYVQRRTSGQWILVNERKTEDGSTVAVYSDITKIKKQEEAIAEQSQALERLSNQLAKYLSPQVYASIFEGRNQGDIASRRKKLTVFFSDIVGFTEITDRIESEDLTRILNQYLTEMSDIALAHGATIDKFVGDAIVIFFGDPESRGVKEDALACVRMALAMKKRLKELNEEWFETGIEKPMQCRMGINTGFCTVGNFGSSERMDYTVIGKGVNVASRLESTAETGEIRISHETYANVKNEILCGNENETTVKGIKFPIVTYEVLSERDQEGDDHTVIREEFQNVKLDINLKDMSDAGRLKAKALLEKALTRIEEEEGNSKS